MTVAIRSLGKRAKYSMIITALVLQEPSIRLWGLGSKERLCRQLREIGGIDWADDAGSLPTRGWLLLLDGRYLFEIRTLQGLLQHPGSVLLSPADHAPAAALVPAEQLQPVLEYLEQPASRSPPQGLTKLYPRQIVAFSEALRHAREPLLEPIDAVRRDELENLLYGNAYRGVTDLVTKFFWPRPARRLVHWCAALGLSPNTVTTIGLLLVIAACYLFAGGHYLAGLAAGWLMTLLDTVDGKLARVTIQSSRFGHLYDHLIDLLHPPFWYVFWGMSLGSLQPVWGLDFPAMCWLLVSAYVAGRLVEGLFLLLGDCSIFTWRPFDAWFRLITARRNPCLIILTLSLLLQRPDWGFVAVVGWSALSTVILAVRLLQGLLARVRRGPLGSWLSEQGAASGPHARSFRLFGGTRGAYGK
jgi:phosphatidylglycerophosphate synthase